MSTPGPDPLGTAQLRAAVLRAWRESPTRFTEDANAEEDLRLGGYADRLFVELAQNAADAAAIAGVPGRLRVHVVDGELRVANTGARLDAAGVAALASLRASAKRHGVTVGRFGVGFAAVLAVSDEPRVMSRSGGVVFSAARTAELAREMPELAEQLAQRVGEVPVLRLVWPAAETEPGPPEGFDTEVRLPLSAGVDPDALLAEIATEVDDVLLAMPSFERIEVGGQSWSRTTDDDVVEVTRDGATRRWLVHTASGEFTPEAAATLGIEAAKHPRWSVLWALPIDAEGRPLPQAEDVLHAPTPTDERVSLPARLIAAVPIEPSRRRVLPGPAVDAVLAAAAAAYPELVRRVAAEHRVNLVPAQGFPLSEVDAALHELIGRQLAEQPWLPAADGRDLPAGRSGVLMADARDLVNHLADVVPDLAADSGPIAARVLASVGASGLAVGDAVDQLAGVDRPVTWWTRLYDLLLPLLDGRTVSADELAGLGVPLLDGRTTSGVRGVVVPEVDSAELLELLAQADVVGLRVAAPDARHPLLQRLGASAADASGLLDAAPLQAAVERSVADTEAGLDPAPLSELVLRLVAETGDGRPWLGALALRSADGDLRRADELLLPSSPLREVFDAEAIGADGAVAVLHDAVLRRWDAPTLTAAGVLDGFAVISDPEPVGPEHQLPDEQQWWEELLQPPVQVFAVRDLDLVADDAWPAALRLLAAEPDCWRALTTPGGHTGWWIARFGLLADASPRSWRLPDCAGLAGLYEPVPDVGLPRPVLAAAGVRGELAVQDAEDAADLLERLADPDREPPPGVVLHAHERLAEARLDFAQLEPPSRVRALDGSVVDAEHAAVLDAPWLLEVVDAGELVGGTGAADRLAELLDLPLATEVSTAKVASTGEFTGWSELGAVGAAAELLGAEVPDGGVIVHPELTVRVDDDVRTARWWVDDDQVHAEDSEAGLARAFAHAAGRWPQRLLIAELLADPTAITLLG